MDAVAAAQAASRHIAVSKALHIIGMFMPKLGLVPALVLALVAGLWAVQVWHQQAKVQATTEVDMALLTDDLPPDAYADPGFAEFLRQDQPAPALPAPVDEPLQVDDLIQEAVELQARESAP